MTIEEMKAAGVDQIAIDRKMVSDNGWMFSRELSTRRSCPSPDTLQRITSLTSRRSSSSKSWQPNISTLLADMLRHVSLSKKGSANG